MFGLVSVLGLVPTVASNKDDPIKSLECKLQSVKGGVNSLKQSVEAGKVLEIELRREIIDLKDQLNETEKKAEQQQQVIQRLEIEKDEMEKANTGDIRKLQEFVARDKTEAAARQQQSFQYAAAWVIYLILVVSICRIYVSSSKRSSDIPPRLSRELGMIRSPPKDSSDVVDHSSPSDNSVDNIWALYLLVSSVEKDDVEGDDEEMGDGGEQSTLDADNSPEAAPSGKRNIFPTPVRLNYDL